MYQSILNIIKKYKLQEFIKFVIVGVISTGINYLIYYFLVKVNINLFIANTIGYAIAFCFNFIASNLFTFKTDPNVKRGTRFIFANIFNYLVQQLLLLFFHEVIKIPEAYAPIPGYFLAIPINLLLGLR